MGLGSGLGLGSGSGSGSGFGFGSGFGLEMAPRVPLGMEVLGSLRLEARLAPERMPVKHGKKMPSASRKKYGAVNAEPQLLT